MASMSDSLLSESARAWLHELLTELLSKLTNALSGPMVNEAVSA